MGLVDIVSEESFSSQLTVNKGQPVICHFWADWCDPCKDLDKILEQFSLKHTNTLFCRVEAEKLSALSQKFDVSVVPTFLFFKNGNVVDKVEGANVPQLVQKISTMKSEPQTSDRSDLNTRLEELTNRAPIMLFMKGVPDEPRCGFSKQMVQILNKENLHFQTFDILQDQEVRQGLKTYSNWPTYPQLYANGKLIGGLDIVKELVEEDEFIDSLGDAAKPKKPLNEMLEELTKKAPIMLFMKGSPSDPKCGFSKQTVQILQKHNANFQTFDILQDQEVRQGLKTYSNWPTYPQLYVNGKLIGGLDIIKELEEEEELKDVLTV